MSVELSTKYLPYVDEKYTSESKSALLTNKDFTFDGAHTVKIRKVTTAGMNNYGRHGPASGNWSRFGEVDSLNSTPETMTLTKDRSFTFVIDKLDENEADKSLAPAAALERQMREVVFPEIDAYVIGKICAGAGTVDEIDPDTAGKDDVYFAVLDGSEALDEEKVPENGRVLVVPPKTFKKLKQASSVAMQMNVGADVIRNGVIAMLDGMPVVRVPSSSLPENTAFLIVHPSATVGVQKLEDYRIHTDPPGISGSLVEGRVVYDAFVLDNKCKGIYLAKWAESPEDEDEEDEDKDEGSENNGENGNGENL